MIAFRCPRCLPTPTDNRLLCSAPFLKASTAEKEGHAHE